MSALARENPGMPERWAGNAREVELALQDIGKTEGWPRCKRCRRYFDPEGIEDGATLCDPCDDGAA